MRLKIQQDPYTNFIAKTGIRNEDISTRNQKAKLFQGIKLERFRLGLGSWEDLGEYLMRKTTFNSPLMCSIPRMLRPFLIKRIGVGVASLVPFIIGNIAGAGDQYFAITERNVSTGKDDQVDGIVFVQIVSLPLSSIRDECVIVLDFVKNVTPQPSKEKIRQRCERFIDQKFQPALKGQPIQGAYILSFVADFPPLRGLNVVDIFYPPKNLNYDKGVCDRALAQYKKRYKAVACLPSK